MANLKAKIKWDPDSLDPIRPANVAFVQGIEDEVVLSFGCVAPHLAMVALNEEQVQEFTKEHSLDLEHATRFILPVRVARVLMEHLKANLDAYDGRARGDDVESTSGEDPSE
jgi:hypothetical protein